MSDAVKKYPVHEVFYSWQGEGSHMGRASFFVRLYGCPIQCPWCDSAGTWRADLLPEKIEMQSVSSIVMQASETRAEFVVITGGEPAIHDLSPLVNALHAAGFCCHLETSGAFPIQGDFDWVTLSPKWQKLPLAENVALANELKLIVDEADAVNRWIEFFSPTVLDEKTIWLNPEWSRRDDPAILESITRWIREHGAPFRAGWQLHKCYNADAVDPRSKPQRQEKII